MILQETTRLSNGVEVPKLALGTWMIEDDVVAEAVKAAVDIGYRHIDTAQAYGNERGVGEGLRGAAVARDEIFVQTKLDANIKNYEGAKAAIDGSLATLGLDHIDLMLIHGPQPWARFGEADRCYDGNLAAWRALEEALEAGKVRSIGVSNFQARDLDNLIDNARVRPMINQVLAHVGNTPFDLIDYCTAKDVAVEAHSPFGHGKVLGNAEIAEIDQRTGVTAPQLCLRYLLQLGLIVLPKTANPAHMKSNAALDFEISAEDMASLKAIDARDYGEASVFPVYSGAT